MPRSRDNGSPADVIGRYQRRSPELDEMMVEAVGSCTNTFSQSRSTRSRSFRRFLKTLRPPTVLPESSDYVRLCSVMWGRGSPTAYASVIGTVQQAEKG